MKEYPKIPMRPEDLPPQEKKSDIILPRCPEGFPGNCRHIDEPDPKKRAPGKPIFLGSVEWSWSPYHSRIDQYYLSSRKPCWLLWIRWQDDNDYEYPWYWYHYGYGRKMDIDSKTAGVHLLMDAWRNDVGEPGHFHWVDNEGLLSSSELYAMGKIVWPDES